MPVRRGVPCPPRHFLSGRAAQLSKRFTTISGGPWPGAAGHGMAGHGYGRARVWPGTVRAGS